MFVTGLCSAGDAMEALLLSFLLQEIRPEFHLGKGTDGIPIKMIKQGFLISR